MIDIRVSDKDYFGEKFSVKTSMEAARFINSHSTKFIRVDTMSNRILMQPEVRGHRKIERQRSIAKTYELFNDIHNHFSSVTVGLTGRPGGTYINRESYPFERIKEVSNLLKESIV